MYLAVDGSLKGCYKDYIKRKEPQMYNRKTALLPVARSGLFDKTKLNFEDIASVWAPCTVQVMDRELRGKVARRFVVGAGKGGYDLEFDASHDQRPTESLGHFTEVASFFIEDSEGKNVEFLRGDAEADIKTAPVLVYK